MKKIFNIPTPFPVIYRDLLNNNIKEMQDKANHNKVELWPHFKTHKSVFIAKKQIEKGASGITCAKLSEAEVLINNGVKNILIAYPIVGVIKYQRLLNLSNYGKITLLFDDFSQIRSIQNFFNKRTEKIFDFYIKVDVGLGRLGIKPDKNTEKIVLNMIKNNKNLNFVGFLSHSGNVYSAKGRDEVYKIACQEIDIMKDMKKRFPDRKDIRLSIGSTPALHVLDKIEGIDSIRPGNYVFNDAIGIALGVCGTEKCSLRVISQVISVYKDRLVIDAGSKTLGLDKGAHSSDILSGYGFILKNIGGNEIDSSLVIDRLSEEHGIVRKESRSALKVGDYIEIIPNHSCYVSNLFDQIYITDDKQNIIQNIKVDARGCVS